MIAIELLKFGKMKKCIAIVVRNFAMNSGKPYCDSGWLNTLNATVSVLRASCT